MAKFPKDSWAINKAICEALSLNPDHVNDVILTLKAGQVAKIEVAGYFGNDRGEVITKIFNAVQWKEGPIDVGIGLCEVCGDTAYHCVHDREESTPPPDAPYRRWKLHSSHCFCTSHKRSFRSHYTDGRVVEEEWHMLDNEQ